MIYNFFLKWLERENRYIIFAFFKKENAQTKLTRKLREKCKLIFFITKMPPNENCFVNWLKKCGKERESKRWFFLHKKCSN